jgi:uncharacterized protein YjbI with pentapeptide repeats
MGTVKGGSTYRFLKPQKSDRREKFRVILKRGAIVLGILLLLSGIVWQAINLLSATQTLETDKRIESQLKIFETLAQILSGGVLLTGLYFTWKNLVATNKNIEIAHEAQINERFTKAIENLGSAKTEVRVGGIFALERMARDAKTFSDYWTIMEILMVYVRENASWKEKAGEISQVIPKTDVQAVLTIFGRRRAIQYAAEETQFIDLQGIDLRKLYLFQADLRRVLLAGAHLEGATLIEARLENAVLMKANFTGADLRGAHLEGADLIDADLSEALLNGAHLEGAHLGRAILRNADLRAAHFEDAYLANAILEGANLEGTMFRKLFPVEREYAFGIGFGKHKMKSQGKALTTADASGLTLDQVRSARNYEKALLPKALEASENPETPDPQD